MACLGPLRASSFFKVYEGLSKASKGSKGLGLAFVGSPEPIMGLFEAYEGLSEASESLSGNTQGLSQD